ncbi:MAG: ATP12 chaperone family protein [Alphaproteobacteria bacterium]|nr:ATP12 chaperone family protein [Alphaproteobacteria bacterium]
MQKFYKQVSTGPAVGGGFVVLLDGRPVRTPAKALMVAPNKALADAMADEWAAQGELVIPDTMPLTQMLTTALDRADARAAMEEAVLAYIDSDLLCYLADEPEGLRLEQEKIWAPWLKWFEKRFGIGLATTYALARLDQPDAAHKQVEATVRAMDIHTFTVFHTVASIAGSIVIGLAFTEGAISPVEAWRCALCEELYYERLHDLEKHGLDPIEQKRRDALARDLDAAKAYLKFIQSATS